MLDGKRHHLERAGTIRVDEGRAAKAILPHQCGQPGNEGRQLFRRRPRSRKQRMLQHASRRRIDAHGHPLDCRRRRMGFEIEQDERPERPHVAHRRGKL